MSQVCHTQGGSFFSKSKLTLQKWLLLMHWWAFEIAVTTAAAQIEVTENTACAAFQWFREVCSTKLCSLQILLGRQGVVVHIEESLFSHKPMVYKITKK